MKIKKIISVGGGTKNQQWLQIQADIFGLPITTLETEQGPSLGAAILAVIGCGMCANIDSCIKMFVKYKKVYQPIEKMCCYIINSFKYIVKFILLLKRFVINYKSKR